MVSLGQGGPLTHLHANNLQVFQPIARYLLGMC